MNPLIPMGPPYSCGPLDISLALAGITLVANAAEVYRATVPESYFPQPGRFNLENQAAHCISRLPFDYLDNIPAKLTAALSAGNATVAMTLQAAQVALLYHATMCILFSAPEESVFRHTVDERWVDSEAFVIAQEHAIKATEILVPLVQAAVTPWIVCLPEVQWCVLRTGLLHRAFLVAAENNGKGAESLAIAAQREMAIHSAALRKAHIASGQGSEPWWASQWGQG